MKILIADDMRNFLDLSRAFLRRTDCEIYTARTGLEALKVATTHKPDIIMLDIEMPEMNGLEVTRILRENPLTGDTPIIIVSASSRERDALTVGANSFMRKPIDEDEFLDTLRRYVPIKVRKDPRRNIFTPARFAVGDRRFEGVVCDVSVSGLYLKTDAKLAVGDNVNVAFDIPLEDGSKTIEADGVVVRKGSDGYGLTFQHLTEGARLYLQDYVQGETGAET